MLFIPIPPALIILGLLLLFGLLNIAVFGFTIWEWICIALFCAIFGSIAYFIAIWEALFLIVVFKIDVGPGSGFKWYLTIIINFTVISYFVLTRFGGL